MSNSFLGTVIKENGLLLLGFAVCLALAGFLFLTGGEDVTDVEPDPRAIDARDGLKPTPTAPPNLHEAVATEAQEVITAYEEQIASEPDHPDTAARLFAAGNMYLTKLGAYKEAGAKYEAIIQNYPEWEGLRTVFPQLEVCFQQEEDLEALDWLYKQMMDLMPPDSQEYLYGKTMLGL
jgi:tetratricopeptide (TPR) repeat protein